MYEKYKLIRTARSGAVLTLIMDNPPLNAVTFDLHESLSHIFYDIARDDCAVVVLTGAGRAFSAGGDLQEMLGNASDPERQAAIIKRAPHIVHSILALEMPIVARVNGHAMGLGATLALLCDVAIMVEDAKIGDPHVNVGLSAGDGGALLWPLMIGYARAKHHLLTGEPLMGAEAAAIGLIHRAVPAEKLDDEVAEYVRRLEKGSRQAISATKRSINMMLRREAEAIVEAHAGLEALTLGSADHREAMAALLQKRKPTFGDK